MFGENDKTTTFGQNDVSTVDTFEDFEPEIKNRIQDALFYSAISGSDPNNVYDYTKEINQEVFGSDDSPMRKNISRPEEFVNSLSRGLANIGSAVQQARANIQKGIQLTPQDNLTWPPGYLEEKQKKAVTKENELNSSAELLWRVANSPELVGNPDIFGRAIGLIGETLPYITFTTASYILAGPLGAFAAGSLVEGNTAYQTAIDSGVDEDKARKIGVGVGAISGAIEAFGGRYVEKAIEKATASFKRKALTAFTTATIVEALEEGTQEVTHLTGESTYRDIDWNEAVQRTLGAMAGGAFLGGTITGGGLMFRNALYMASEKPSNQKATQKPAEPTKAPEIPTTPVEPTSAKPAPQAKTEAVEAGQVEKAPEAKAEKVESLTEEEITPEEQKVLEAEEAELVRPRLYIGNVTEGMKRRIADVMGWTKEQIKGFTEKGWPTKRTEVPLTRGEAEVALEDLTNDLKNRLDNNQINTENDLALANAMWGNIAEIRKALGMEKGQAPFKVIRAKGQPMKIIKNAKSRIWAAIQPGTLQESKMTVGEVLRAVVKGKAREAKMAWAAGRRELRSAIRMKKRAKARMEKALKSIKKKIPDSVDFYYREAIETLREGIDLKVKTEKAKESIQRTREFLDRVPEHEEKMPTKLMERLYKKPLVDYTIEELEQIASEIDTLIEQGKLKRELTEKPKKKFREKVVQKMVDTIEKGKAIKTKASKITSKGFLWSWRPQRIFDWLDNRANFDGLVHKIFYDSVKDAKAKAWNWVDKRVNPGTAKLKEFGLTRYDLARHRMTFEKSKTGKIERMTLDKMIGVYLFNKNPMSRLALLHGNEFTQKEIDDIISNLSENEKAWGDYMMDDFKQHWERYRSSVIEQENRDPGSAEFYFSMRRQERDYKTLDQEIIDELLHRAGLRKAYAEHGASLKRKHIPPEFQKPIKLDATGVWLEQVTAQEHYMNIGPIVRDLNSILNNNKFRKAVENRGGRALTKWLQNYVNAVANPNFYRSFNDIEKISRMIRQNAAIAYLGFNVVTMGKQLPSVFLYLPDAGISHLLQSAVEFAIDPMKTIREVRELDPFVKHKLMEREFAELEKTRTGTAGLIHQEVGMRSLEGIFFFDMIARTIGWKAVYNRGIADGLSQEEAVRKARNATLRTQPAAAAEDLPQLYRTSEFLNVFTQFTNQLNQLFNIATYDMPSMLLNKKYGDAALGGLGMSIVAATIWMIAHRKLPEEPEEVVEMFSEQAINMLPLFGKSIQAKRNGWESDVPVMQAISTLLGTPIKTLEDWDISEYEFKKILESIAVLTGTPYTQPERVYRAIKEEEPSALIGGRKKKKKTTRRKIGRRG